MIQTPLPILKFQMVHNQPKNRRQLPGEECAVSGPPVPAASPSTRGRRLGERPLKRGSQAPTVAWLQAQGSPPMRPLCPQARPS